MSTTTTEQKHDLAVYGNEDCAWVACTVCGQDEDSPWFDPTCRQRQGSALTEESTIPGLDADLVERIRLVYANNNHTYLTMETLDREDEELRELGVGERHLQVFNEQLRIGFRCDNDGYHWTERKLTVSPVVLCAEYCWMDYIDGER